MWNSLSGSSGIYHPAADASGRNNTPAALPADAALLGARLTATTAGTFPSASFIPLLSAPSFPLSYTPFSMAATTPYATPSLPHNAASNAMSLPFKSTSPTPQTHQPMQVGQLQQLHHQQLQHFQQLQQLQQQREQQQLLAQTLLQQQLQQIQEIRQIQQQQQQASVLQQQGKKRKAMSDKSNKSKYCGCKSREEREEFAYLIKSYAQDWVMDRQSRSVYCFCSAMGIERLRYSLLRFIKQHPKIEMMTEGRKTKEKVKDALDAIEEVRPRREGEPPRGDVAALHEEVAQSRNEKYNSSSIEAVYRSELSPQGF